MLYTAFTVSLCLQQRRLTCRREGVGGISHRWMKALPISYSVFSGMIGTQSVLFSKALSTLMRTTIDGDSQLDSWFFWLVLLLFLCCAYFWVTRLNQVRPSPVFVTLLALVDGWDSKYAAFWAACLIPAGNTLSTVSNSYYCCIRWLRSVLVQVAFW